jgi:hypothetical protein
VSEPEYQGLIYYSVYSGVYIALIYQLEAAYNLLVATQAVESTEGDMKALNERIQWQLQNSTRGLRFVKLNKESL